MLLLLGSFIAGILTVLSPCVIPLLPVILGGSVTNGAKDTRRPIIITAALALSLIAFSLLLKTTTLFIYIPARTVDYLSGGIIVVLGICLLFPALYLTLIIKLGLEPRAQGLMREGYRHSNSFLGPIIIGVALGPVFSSCSPLYAYIVATILPANLAQGLAYLIVYSLGLSAVLLLIGYFGQRVTSRIKFAANPKGWFQRIIAVFFIVIGLLVIAGYNTAVEIRSVQHLPLTLRNLK